MTDQHHNQRFKLTLEIKKAYERVEKDGSTTFWIGGKASGTKIDRDGERMALSAVRAMQQAIEKGITDRETKDWSYVPLRMEHSNRYGDKIGWMRKAYIDENHELWVEAELDPLSPNAVYTYKTLTKEPEAGKPSRLGFSIGGLVASAGYERDDTTGRMVRTFYDIDLDEVSVVSAPSYKTSTVTVALEKMQKSVDWDRLAAAREEEPMEDEITSEEQVAKTDALAQAADEAETVERQVADAVEPGAEQVAKTDASDEATDDDGTDALTEEVAKAVEAGDAETVAKDVGAEMREALYEKCEAAIDRIAEIANTYQYLRSEVSYLSSMLVERGYVAAEALDALRKGEQPADAESVSKETEAVVVTEVVKATEVAENVATPTDEQANTDLFERLGKAMGEQLAPLVDSMREIPTLVETVKGLAERVVAIEEQPLDRSLAVTKNAKLDEPVAPSDRLRKAYTQANPDAAFTAGMRIAMGLDEA